MKKTRASRYLSIFICVSLMLLSIFPMSASANTQEAASDDVVIAEAFAALGETEYKVVKELSAEQETVLEAWREEMPEAYIVSYECLAAPSGNLSAMAVETQWAIAVPGEEVVLEVWDEKLAVMRAVGASYTILYDQYSPQARVQVTYSCHDDRGFPLNVNMWGQIVTDKGSNKKTTLVTGSGSFYTLWVVYGTASSCKGSCGQV